MIPRDVGWTWVNYEMEIPPLCRNDFVSGWWLLKIHPDSLIVKIVKWDEIRQQYSEDAFFPISKVHKKTHPESPRRERQHMGTTINLMTGFACILTPHMWYWKQNIEPVCSTSIIGDVEPALVVLRCSWFLHVQWVSDFTSYLFFAHDMAQTFTVQYITVATYGVFSWNQVVVLSDLVVAIVSSNNMRGHFRQIDQIRFHIMTFHQIC